jgi:hypothetical protein
MGLGAATGIEIPGEFRFIPAPPEEGRYGIPADGETLVTGIGQAVLVTPPQLDVGGPHRQRACGDAAHAYGRLARCRAVARSLPSPTKRSQPCATA